MENIKKIKNALSSLPDNAISLIKDDEVQKYAVIRIADEIVIDLMAKAGGIDYMQASKDMEFITIEGISIPIPKKQTLIKMKETFRPSDKVDTDFLKMLLEEEAKPKK